MNKKRLVKNIIMIILALLGVISLLLTINYKKNNTSNNSMPNPPSMNNSNNSNNNTPPDKPSDNSSNDSTNTPPDKPDNSNDSNTNNTQDSNSNESTTNTPPDIPNNNGSNNTQPSINNTNNTFYYIIFGIESLVIVITITYLIMSNFNKKSFKETFKNKDKVIIYILIILLATGVITIGCNSIKNNPSNNSQLSNNNESSNNISYSATKEVTSDTTLESEKYSSSSKNKNALLVSDAKVITKGLTINKTGDASQGDSTSFYGINSGVLAKDGAVLTIEDATIKTDAIGANGVFSYGGSATTSNSSSDGTTVNIKNSTIETTKDSSGGIMATGGGIINATNLNIKTSGISSAAIRSDRGGGTINVNKGTYSTSGKGSPAIYSTADIIVKNATLTSTSSEGVVIEGKNKVTLENTKLTDTNDELNGKSTTYKNIFLYQSMSGDADAGASEFNAKDSDIVTNKGDTFYITNTTAKITLENNKITNNDKNGYFLRSQKDSWGNTNSNGGNVDLTLKNQKVEGDIYLDSISTLNMTLSNKSVYTGTINKDNTAKTIKLKLSKNSKIKLTGTSYITSLDDEDTSYSNIDFNGYKLYVNGESIN